MASKNPGAIAGTEIVAIQVPFGGWVSTPTGAVSAPHYTASIEGVQGSLQKEQVNNYAESNGISLFRKEHFGHIAPGPVFTKFTDPSITDLPVNGAGSSTTFPSIVLKNGRVIQITKVVGAVNQYFDPDLTDAPHAGHTPVSTRNVDVITMFDLAGTPLEYTFWSWEDNTDADIDIFHASSQTHDWFSSIAAGVAGLPASGVLKKGVPHKLCQGPDANLYVANGNQVIQVVINGDIASATIGNILNIGTNWIVSSIVSYKNYVAIAAYQSSSDFTFTGRGATKVFLWTGISSTVNGVTSVAAEFSFDIPDNFINTLYFDGNVLYAFTSGRNNSSKIWEFTGKGFKKVFETALISSSANPTQGNVENYQDGLMIGATKSSENAYLFRFYGGGFHCDALLSDGTNTATDVGMIKNLYLDWIVAGVKYGSIYALFYSQNANYQVNAQIKTILYTEGILGRRLYPLGFKMTVSRIQIFLAQWGTGASLTLSLFKDYTTTDLLAARVIDTTTYPVGTTEIDISDIAVVDVSSFYMTITFSHASPTNTAAIIRRGIVYLEPSQ